MDHNQTLLSFFSRPIERDPPSMPEEEHHGHWARPSVQQLSGGGTHTDVQNLEEILEEVLEVDRFENFSLFIPKHREIAGKLIKHFFDLPDAAAICTSVRYFKEKRINPYLRMYALSVAMLHRKDTQNQVPPSVISYFPEKFIDSKTLAKCRDEINLVPNQKNRKTIVIPKNCTATDYEEEHRLAYWREDLGINLHHWHWHEVYPFSGSEEIVRKDRRGELFYYMHRQLILRYNFERLCNKLKRVQKLGSMWDPIQEAYFPKMQVASTGDSYTPRPSNQFLRDVNREYNNQELRASLEDMQKWRLRILDAIDSNSVLCESGKRKQLRSFTQDGIEHGIDVLGNIIEASDLSPFKQFYGDFHNSGHILTGFIHDPDNRHLERLGVMADVATAMRDPVFYRWHKYIDEIFQSYKETLPAYTDKQLNYPGIKVVDYQLVYESDKYKPNTFYTFWKESALDLGGGMDFQAQGSIFVRFTHLDHKPFTYRIYVFNAGSCRKGTVRIFLAPKCDEAGMRWLLKNQRHSFIEMDRFVEEFKSGANTIQRKSIDSSLTIPFERTFKRSSEDKNSANKLKDSFCACGWPQHVLVPRGNRKGFPCQLFVMISDYEDDKVDCDGKCTSGVIYCGIRNKRYPDRRAMGFPFDRRTRDTDKCIEDFVGRHDNMGLQDVSILFGAVDDNQ